MAKSFTPGLKVLKNYTLQKDRILPIKGKVHQDINNSVESCDIVASTFIPGNIKMINVANKLNVEPSYIKECMQVKVGDKVSKDEILAQNKGLFGLFKTEIKSPVSGEITQISEITGQLVIEEKPDPIEIDAYIPGVVKKVYNEEGIRLESSGTYIQGIIGVGGEKQGKLIVIADSPEYVIKESEIISSHNGCILVVGSFLTYDLYKKAESIGVSGIITGGFDYNSLSRILGYSLGVAITGTEKGMTLIITEGFGQVKMSNKTFNLLLNNNNNNVSINGSTQIRAGVLRPEIFIASKKDVDKFSATTIEDLIISIGSRVRIIREPYFGQLGKVIKLPAKLEKMESGTMTRVAKVLFDDSNEEIIPRTNLEVILSD